MCERFALQKERQQREGLTKAHRRPHKLTFALHARPKLLEHLAHHVGTLVHIGAFGVVLKGVCKHTENVRLKVVHALVLSPLKPRLGGRIGRPK